MDHENPKNFYVCMTCHAKFNVNHGPCTDECPCYTDGTYCLYCFLDTVDEDEYLSGDMVLLWIDILLRQGKEDAENNIECYKTVNETTYYRIYQMSYSSK